MYIGECVCYVTTYVHACKYIHTYICMYICIFAYVLHEQIICIIKIAIRTLILI